jgi:hypothetical protein
MACGDTTAVPTLQLNFDRPIDVAFACYGGLRLTHGAAATVDQEVLRATAQPQEACVIRSGDPGAGPTPVPAGQENLTADGGDPVPGALWYGFILNSAPGTVSLVTFPTQPATAFTGVEVKIVDADPLTPGTNSIAVGEDPIAIATDRSGCFEVIANAGSCDLSALEINSALDVDPAVNVTRMAVKNASGQVVQARAAATCCW